MHSIQARVAHVRPETQWQTDAIHWEAEARHLKKTATELLDTNSRYASMFEVLKAESSAHVNQLQALLEASQLENQQLQRRIEEAGRHAQAEESHRKAELTELRRAVCCLGKDASRSSDEQLSTLADTNKALVNVLVEKDRMLRLQELEISKLRLKRNIY